MEATRKLTAVGMEIEPRRADSGFPLRSRDTGAEKGPGHELLCLVSGSISYPEGERLLIDMPLRWNGEGVSCKVGSILMHAAGIRPRRPGMITHTDEAAERIRLGVVMPDGLIDWRSGWLPRSEQNARADAADELARNRERTVRQAAEERLRRARGMTERSGPAASGQAKEPDDGGEHRPPKHTEAEARDLLAFLDRCEAAGKTDAAMRRILYRGGSALVPEDERAKLAAAVAAAEKAAEADCPPEGPGTDDPAEPERR